MGERLKEVKEVRSTPETRNPKPETRNPKPKTLLSCDMAHLIDPHPDIAFVTILLHSREFLEGAVGLAVQGYLAHTKTPTPLGLP